MRHVDARSTNIREHAEALDRLTLKRDNEVTLTANAASTTVTVAGRVVTPDSLYSFDPLTAHAAAELAAGTMFVAEADRLRGSFVITHANNAQTDRTFRWIALGD